MTGIGLEPVLCAHTTTAKNPYTLMQVAHILWVLTCKGSCQGIFATVGKWLECGVDATGCAIILFS